MSARNPVAIERDEFGKPSAAVGPGAGLEFIEAFFPSATKIRIASAYFSLAGYRLGRDHARQDVEFHVLVGREEGGNVRKAVMDEIQMELRSCETDLWQAVADLVHRMRSGKFKIRDARSMQTPFHCKFYICDADRMWHGSANYSQNGLKHNAEQITGSTSQVEIALFTRWYDEVAQNARDLLGEMIAILEQWLRVAKPFDVYAKIVYLLNSLPAPGLGPGAHSPAYYQQAVVARSLHQIEEFGGTLVVLATGLGKTIVGAEIAHRLSRNDQIDSVILLAPNAVRGPWKDEMEGRKLRPWFFPTDVLFRPDSPRRHHKVHQVMKRLRLADERTLIIVDEVHFYRNQLISEKQKRRPSRVFSRFRPAVERGAKVVLLTATAYGTNRENLNSLLRLLPPRRTGLFDVRESWRIENPHEFANLPMVTILGLPDVLNLARKRGDVDDGGQPFIAIGEARQYLPREVRLMPIFYNLPLQTEIQGDFDAGYFSQLKKIRHLDFDDDAGEIESVTDPGYNTALNSWLSSPIALKEFLEHSLEWEESPQLTLAGALDRKDSDDVQLDLLFGIATPHKKAYATFARGPETRRERLEPRGQMLEDSADHKLQELIRIVRTTSVEQNGKLLIFVKRYPTALYLKSTLPKMVEGLRVACTVENRQGAVGLKSRNARDEILSQFSPASDAERASDKYDVLICTDADGVGVNLQAADTVINYDPPSAADVLFQRAGRVLRATPRPNRIVTIYTLVPSIVNNTDSSGVSARIRTIFHRLRRRHDRSQVLTGSRLLSDSEGIDPLQESRVDVEQWFQQGDLASSLSAVSVSRLASHMALLQEHGAHAEALPVPLHGAKLTGRFTEPRVVIFFECDGAYQLILYNLATKELEITDTQEILDFIQSDPDENPTPMRFEDIEHAANLGVQLWCEQKEVDPTQPLKICALYLQPVSHEPTFRQLLKTPQDVV